MRVVLPSAGTRGDVQPVVALGLELAARGHDVTIGAPPNLVTFARSAGLAAEQFGPDVQQLYSSDRGQRALAVGSTFKLMPLVAKQMSDYADQMDGELIDISRDADIIVSTQLTEDRAHAIAEAQGIPQLTMHTFPSRRNRVYAFPGSVSHTRKLPAPVVSATWRTAENIRRIGFGKYTNRLRRRLGLTPLRATIESTLAREGVPEVQIYHRALVPGLAEAWGTARPLVGFLPLPRSARESIGELADQHTQVVEWAESDDPPVYFGLGSMPIRDADAVAGLVEQVCADLGRRALISAGWTSMEVTEPAPGARVLRVGALAHDLVLPHCAAAVHHGGIGTTYESLRAGLPTVVCSVSFDQPFWGAQVVNLGVGAHFAFPKLNADTLTDALNRALRPAVAENAQAIGSQLADSDGAVSVVADMVEQRAG